MNNPTASSHARIAVLSLLLAPILSAQPGPLVVWGYPGQMIGEPPQGTFVAAAGGAYHGYAMQSDGKLVAWGSNSQGQLELPVGTYKAIFASKYNSFGILIDGTLVTAGWVETPIGMFNYKYKHISTSLGSGFFIGIRDDDTLIGWGNDYYPGYPTWGYALDLPSGPFVSVAVGLYHAVGIRPDGTLLGWGYDKYGQASVPPGEFVSISAGNFFSAGVRTDGTISAWGTGPAVTEAPKSGSYSSVVCFGDLAFALRSDGVVVKWGYPAGLWQDPPVKIASFSFGPGSGCIGFPLSCDPDCDSNGALTIDDFICFQTLFAIGDPGADCDGDGDLLIDDFICFQTSYAIGC